MAYTTKQHPTAPDFFSGLLTTLRKTRESLVHIFFSFGEHSYRLQELQELVQMSDEQLAARNLRREDIVHHIFSHQHVG